MVFESVNVCVSYLGAILPCRMLTARLTEYHRYGRFSLERRFEHPTSRDFSIQAYKKQQQYFVGRNRL